MANIKVGANTSDFQKEMKAMVVQLKQVNSEFNLSATKAKLYGTEQDRLKVKQQEFTTKIKMGNDQIKLQSSYIDKLTNDLVKNRSKNMQLNDSIDKVNSKLQESIKKTGKSSEETKALEKELEGLKRQLNGNEKQFDATNAKLDTNKTKLNNMKTALMESEKSLKDVNRTLSTMKFDEFSKKCDTISTKLNGIGNFMSTRVTIPMIGLSAVSTNLASDMMENVNKVEATFEENSQTILDWSKTTLDSYGIASGSALEYASTIGDMLKGIGFGKDKIGDMSKTIIGMSSDIASFKNSSPEEVFSALSAAMTGEYEQLKKYGYVINESILNEYAKSKGIKKTTKEMTLQEKALLALSKIQDYAKDANGDFAKTADGNANSSRIFKESLKELGATIGQDLLPTLTPLVQDATKLVKGFANMDESTRKNIVRFGMFAAAIGPVAKGFGGLIKIGGGVSSVFSKVSGKVSDAGGVMKMLSSPVGRATLVIGALVLAGIALYKNWDTIKEKCGQAWGSIQSKIKEHGGGIEGFMGFLGDSMKEGWKQAWNAIDEKTGGTLSTVKSKIKEHGGGIKGLWGAQWEAMNEISGGKLDAIKEKVSGWGDNIKNFFSNLHFPSLKFPEFNFPHIKLPHFNLSGSFSLNPPSIPKVGVDWYWRGGIIDTPTVLGNIGVGDKFEGMGRNAEAIVPLDSMYRNIDAIVNKRVKQSQQVIYVLVDNTIDINGKAIKALSKETLSKIKQGINKEQQNNLIGRGVAIA